MKQVRLKRFIKENWERWREEDAGVTQTRFDDAESAIASCWLEIDAPSAYETTLTVFTSLET